MASDGRRQNPSLALGLVCPVASWLGIGCLVFVKALLRTIPYTWAWFFPWPRLIYSFVHYFSFDGKSSLLQSFLNGNKGESIWRG